MKHLAPLGLAAAIALSPLAAAAQEADDNDGFNLMEEGARLFLRGIVTEMEPALDDLRGLAEELQPQMRVLADEMGSALAQLAEKLDDIRYYEMPQVLDNGDILIRRRADAPPYVAPDRDMNRDEPETAPEPVPDMGNDSGADMDGEIDL